MFFRYCHCLTLFIGLFSLFSAPTFALEIAPASDTVMQAGKDKKGDPPPRPKPKPGPRDGGDDD